MLDRTNRDIQKTDQSSTTQNSLEASIASSALASETATKHAAMIAKVRAGMVPAERLDILETEAKESLKHASPTIMKEWIFSCLGSFSERQEALIARAADTAKQIRDSKLLNATHELQAAMVVEGTYQEIFSFNGALRTSRDLLSRCNVLADTHDLVWPRYYNASGLLERGARAHFELLGMKKESDGWIPEENYWAIKDAQNVLLAKTRQDAGGALGSLQRHIVELIPQLKCLDDAAIKSADGKISIPCNLGAEAMQRTARELDEQRQLLVSGQHETELFQAMDRADLLTEDFKRFTRVALEQIENTETMIRRCIQKAFFPQIKELLRLEQLYTAHRVRGLEAQLGSPRND